MAQEHLQLETGRKGEAETSVLVASEGINAVVWPHGWRNGKEVFAKISQSPGKTGFI